MLGQSFNIMNEMVNMKNQIKLPDAISKKCLLKIPIKTCDRVLGYLVKYGSFWNSFFIEHLPEVTSVSASCSVLETEFASHIYVKNDKNKTSYLYVCTNVPD